MDNQERKQWNEKWRAQLAKAKLELLEKSAELNRLDAEIGCLITLILMIQSQIEPEPPA
jgi:hypothetical protein